MDPDLARTLARVYGADAAPGVVERLLDVARAAHRARPDDLRALDDLRLSPQER